MAWGEKQGQGMSGINAHKTPQFNILNHLPLHWELIYLACTKNEVALNLDWDKSKRENPFDSWQAS